MNNPLISVLIPAYKRRYLGQAIECVLSQTFKDYELIIVNDASNEDLDSVVLSYNDKRIRYFKNNINIGRVNVVRNWNRCLEYALGKYVVLFSDDDIYESTFLEEMILMTQKYPHVDVFHSRVRIIDSLNKTITYSTSGSEYENIYDFMWHRIIKKRAQYATEFLFKASSIKRIGGFISFPLAWGSDDATWFILAKGNGIVFINKVLVCWRLSDINISSVGNIEMKMKAIDAYISWLNDFIADLKPISNQDYDCKIEILKKLPIRKQELKSNLLTKLIAQNSYFNKLFKCIHYGQKYSIPYGRVVQVFLKSIHNNKIFNNLLISMYLLGYTCF